MTGGVELGVCMTGDAGSSLGAGVAGLCSVGAGSGAASAEGAVTRRRCGGGVSGSNKTVSSMSTGNSVADDGGQVLLGVRNRKTVSSNTM